MRKTAIAPMIAATVLNLTACASGGKPSPPPAPAAAADATHTATTAQPAWCKALRDADTAFSSDSRNATTIPDIMNTFGNFENAIQPYLGNPGILRISLDMGRAEAEALGTAPQDFQTTIAELTTDEATSLAACPQPPD